MSRKHAAANGGYIRGTGDGGLFRPTKQQREDHHRSLPVPMRQLIVDLKAEYPDFSLREIAEICYVQFDRRPSHNTIKQVLADGPTPLRTTRQYPLYADIPDPAERRLAVIRLHAQGWSVTSIAAYLGVARKTIYQILKRLSSKKGYAVWRTSRMPIRIGSLRWIYVPAIPSANCKRTHCWANTECTARYSSLEFG